ncbi:MAG TPA: 2Fe-2S iron-sulfur cluster-binding protein [Nevskiaceae bacterium]|nr:2Fe-2S iron-sulfur cluster-binding protein [Nevskiaceae bacterium]
MTRVVLRHKGVARVQAHVPGETLYETSCRARMPIPTNCRNGLCGTCAVRLVDGRVSMRKNNILTQEEVDGGLVLGCQGEPVGERCEIQW